MADQPEDPSLEQVIAEIVEADERGDALDPEQVLAKYPQYEMELREFLELHGQLSDTNPPASSTHLGVESQRLARSELSSSLAINPPREFGDYEILSEIDRGGMGVVYKARHRRLSRLVALKLIRSGELASAEEVERFLSEAEAAAALSHPGIVPIYEVGTLHGLVFYTMAYIEGQSLAGVVAEGALDPIEAARIVHKLCDAVQYAHEEGVYHRDLKPANVLINANGHPVIIDFGLAKFAHRDNALTATGQILGTPAYMAPEQATGRASDIGPESDVYSMGAILYFLCAGQPVFSGPSPFDVLIQVLDRRPPAPSKFNKHIDRQFDHICLKSLEKKRSDRYPSARALAGDLHRILTDQPVDTGYKSAWQRVQNWWQREPILAAHIVGIGVTTLIVAVAYNLRGEISTQFRYRMLLLVSWLVMSVGLQYWVYLARWRDFAILSWLFIDVTIFTTLIAFADEPRSMLLIGYPMMVVASSLFYQRKYAIVTTVLCSVGFALLGWLFPKDDFVKPDFSAIFICGLIVINLCVLAMIRKFRGLSRFYEDSNF